jgi:ketosteroid isomerase-like protein
MRFVALLFLCALSALAQDDKKEVLSLVGKFFDGMSTANSAMIASTMTSDAKLVSAQPDKIGASMTGEAFAQRIGANKNHLLERIWDPTVLVRGRIATVWAEYDLHVSGKFNHCGIDAFTLLKTDEGWKISGIQYTTETQNCKPSPLGPPQP